ncbi:MAG: hypothetical protein CVU16_14795 [Betaproteobacteria bacterium HGW-Betaproteobacteria-10]|nr:MAG: hypothetical protein CVU16_14795 [Betaproteobacteria bacterium HGW-Betaproteobacteria-10]
MKKITALCVAISLALGASSNALADRGRHDNYRQHHNHGRHYGSSWAGPAAILAITGLAIGAAVYGTANATPVYAEPAYIPPPRLVQAPPASGTWYYCGSSGQYYPYVRYCNEGWQPVMPPRQ